MPPAAIKPLSSIHSLMSSPTRKTSNQNDPLRGAVQIVEDQLYYVALKSHPRSDVRSSNTNKSIIHYFHIDTELVYWNFFLDFGPLNLGQLYRFASTLNEKLQQYPLVCFYSSTVPAKRANAIYLICAWQVLYLNRTPEEAYAGFRRLSTGGGSIMNTTTTSSASNVSAVALPLTNNSSKPPKSSSASITTCAVPPFHDASPCICTFDLTILDCLRGLAKARTYGFFDYNSFDVEEYEHFEQVENGDLNWIIKDRILAFAGPHFKRNVSMEGYCTLTPADYIPYFTKKNIELVVRLNKKAYNEEEFLHAGIRHVEQYYLDGSCPPMRILNQVVSSFETVPPHKAFAVHCKAGLGRTGTCIGAFLMKHYKFTAAEAIGWMRICRPGMVIGPQQHFLADIEQRMWHEGSVMSMRPNTQDVKLLRVQTSSSSEEEQQKPPDPPTKEEDTTSSSSSGDEVMTTATSNSNHGATATATPKDKGSPRSVLQGPVHFGSLTTTTTPSSSSFMTTTTKSGNNNSDAVMGRAGQADGLLSRRNHNNTRTTTTSSTTSSSSAARRLFDSP
mmetsp:Transcript_29081/g.42822  ORF Transcript_29081/g.42822 Transcript_29081/m.42822 type:complete len:560 (-) Transcript_29081:451-2130(-)|eukprot:CAMPEP_0194049588 /NCGR_PEP_ID=MMETSP0009_2-20130614/30773_1 /TAXON_ID=210454 /ORGANISM="Grammatophora oceanica, Strain CCMP 410" /LENGTH=559 /DNA_ID=CAMNT_0038695789 /DNA_START=369 /DNA_END=2048 /DNA_ORIENTATION=-